MPLNQLGFSMFANFQDVNSPTMVPFELGRWLPLPGGRPVLPAESLCPLKIQTLNSEPPKGWYEEEGSLAVIKPGGWGPHEWGSEFL